MPVSGPGRRDAAFPATVKPPTCSRLAEERNAGLVRPADFRQKYLRAGPGPTFRAQTAR
jgi:hypothetical protein